MPLAKSGLEPRSAKSQPRHLSMILACLTKMKKVPSLLSLSSSVSDATDGREKVGKGVTQFARAPQSIMSTARRQVML